MAPHVFSTFRAGAAIRLQILEPFAPEQPTDAQAAIVAHVDRLNPVQNWARGSTQYADQAGLRQYRVRGEGQPVCLFGPQIEAGFFPSQYIATTAASRNPLGRARDEFVIETPDGISEGSWRVDIWPAFSCDDILAQAANEDEETGVNAIGFLEAGVSSTNIRFKTTQSFCQVCLTHERWICTDLLKWDRDERVAVEWNRVAGTLTAGGVTTQKDSSKTWVLPIGGMRIGAGEDFDGNIRDEFFGRIGRVRGFSP